MTIVDESPELATEERAKPLVLVTVGSDHHPFDRLVRWVDDWLSGGVDVECIVQYGTAQPPRLARGVDYLPHAELQLFMAAADVVIVQGGPMSIVEVQRHGKRPIVVPRTAALGEVVDDHQHAFCQRLADQDRILLATDAGALAVAAQKALDDPDTVRIESDRGRDLAIEKAVATFGAAVDEVLGRRSPGPKVVMLGGFGRSGSTLLERMLGEVPGVVALGEVLHLWERGLRDGERCGCGVPFRDCPFWQRVGVLAFGTWDNVEADGAVADRLAVVGNKRVPGLVVPIQSVARRLRRDRLLRRLDALYAAAAKASDARLLIDSSKHPAYAFLLRRSAVQLRCVLVVRDPRGVAWSWGKTVVRPEVAGSTKHMPTYRPIESILRWSVYGFLFQALSVLGIPLLVVRYEDAVSDPTETLRRILRFAGIEPVAGDLSHIRGADVYLSPHHTVAGNPMRFRTGLLALRLDDAWRTAMPAAQQRILGALTRVQRRAYGYRRR